MLTTVLLAMIFLAAGFTQGISGFGSALLAMPLLTMFIDVKIAVPLCILNGLLITSYLSMKLMRFLEWRKILPLLAGSLPGIYIGVMFLKNADSNIIKMLLGILIISYGCYSLFFSPRPRKLHRAWSYAAGFGTGFIGSAFSAGGPPTIIYTTLTGWSRDHIKATLSGFFLVSGAITAVVHSASGLVNAQVLKYFTFSALFVLLGVYTGSRLYNRINRQAYIRVMLVTLILLGFLMIVSTL
jgi:uncharacterized membrane protein YfcA